MILDLLGNADYLRVLRALERRPMRFVLIEQVLALNPARVDRALKFLLKGKWIISGAADTATGRFIMAYSLTRRGEAFLASFRDFASALQRREEALGSDAAREIRAVLN